jgi:hypothetical protein
MLTHSIAPQATPRPPRPGTQPLCSRGRSGTPPMSAGPSRTPTVRVPEAAAIVPPRRREQARASPIRPKRRSPSDHGTTTNEAEAPGLCAFRLHTIPADYRLQAKFPARPNRTDRAAAVPGCGSGPFPPLLTVERVASAHGWCRGEPIVIRPTKAIARRTTAPSRGSTCASSGRCSRPPARGTTAESVALL